MRYEDYFTPDQVSTFKIVKRGQMHLAEVARDVVCDLTGGRIDGGRTSKEFVHTHLGFYRMANRANSDNTTEDAAHIRLHATTVNMSDELEMLDFFRRHGLPARETLKAFHAEIHERLNNPPNPPLF